MHLLLMAPFFYESVAPANVATGYEYADPVAPTSGTNAGIAPTTDPPTLDTSPAAFLGWTQPALSAVTAGVDLPDGSVGTGAPPPPDPSMIVPIVSNGCLSMLRLIRGDDYTGGRALSFLFTSSAAPAAGDSATITWRDPYCDEVIGTATTSNITTIGDDYAASFSLPNFAADNRPGQWPFDVEITSAAGKRTVATGILDLVADQTR